MKSENPPNKLIYSSSPYLLQHAYNPVNWFPWGEEALIKAREEDKLILVSIGYSACHWCHVMEHESFEDHEVAEIMNQHFVCIKVDREERPDIDQVYMSAVQIMTGRGGWPLNCFTLPDTRPVYGGTYFPKAQWKTILLNLATIYQNDKPKFEDYAQQLTEGISKHEQVLSIDSNVQFDHELILKSINNWKQYFDYEEGGSNHAPKFPMPGNYRFLTACIDITNDENLKSHVLLTLEKMAFGGIYDQIGGGFARYSVDGEWKIPHFEKMLYDNAQLISLYSEAFRLFKDPLYKEVVYHTIDFVSRELTGNNGNLFSALDADSEGVEGKYYIWTKEEFQMIAGVDFPLMADYFNINEKGYWEHGNYIPLRKNRDNEIAVKHNISEQALRSKIEKFRINLLSTRSKRIPPGLDDKTLTSWNALMITAYLDAFDAFGENSFLKSALKIAEFILRTQLKSEGNLLHNYKNEKSTINGFLEDYAFFIHSLIRLYQSTFEIKWLHHAKDLMTYALVNFGDDETGMFYFTSSNDAPLIARKMEIQDNVIPASNSQMAINLFLLGHYFDNEFWINRSKKMLVNMSELISEYPSAYSNWLNLWLYFSQSLREVVFCGEHALEKRNEFAKEYLNPGTILAGCIDKENVNLTQNRLVQGKTLIYVCIEQSCKLPVENPNEALSLLE